MLGYQRGVEQWGRNEGGERGRGGWLDDSFFFVFSGSIAQKHLGGRNVLGSQVSSLGFAEIGVSLWGQTGDQQDQYRSIILRFIVWEGPHRRSHFSDIWWLWAYASSLVREKTNSFWQLEYVSMCVEVLL